MCVCRGVGGGEGGEGEALRAEKTGPQERGETQHLPTPLASPPPPPLSLSVSGSGHDYPPVWLQTGQCSDIRPPNRRLVWLRSHWS